MQVAEGQVCVITGAASGIGLGMAEAFAARGLKLVLADIDQHGLDRAVADLGAKGCAVIGVRTDVSDSGNMERLRDAVIGRFGRVDIACLNAGIVSPFRPMWENGLADWGRVLGVDLWGVIHGIRLFTPLMIDQGRGHIVNTASMAGLIVVPSNGIYNAAKHAVVSLSETLRADLDKAGHPVGVTVVCPGMVTININKAHGADGKDSPVPKDAVYLTPADVARQVIAAIEINQLYLATNPGGRIAIDVRLDRLLRETATPL